MKIILAPHLDDEIIGCFSILDSVDQVWYFTDDYRVAAIEKNKKYKKVDHSIGLLLPSDTVYAPSRWDYHPLHKVVNALALKTHAQLFFYSVEMNVPWLEEEADPKAKKTAMMSLYLEECDSLVNDKYWLFKSIKPYDEEHWFEVNIPLFNDINLSVAVMDQDMDNSSAMKLLKSILTAPAIADVINKSGDDQALIPKLFHQLVSRRYPRCKVTIGTNTLKYKVGG